mmetsp:Transcript_44376/g.71343  ORF Transcript_44376/g.71343 Transcript_44376/m.71343 type:complete len:89 (-) Transcript_44376:1282-1548(-)
MHLYDEPCSGRKLRVWLMCVSSSGGVFGLSQSFQGVIDYVQNVFNPNYHPPPVEVEVLGVHKPVPVPTRLRQAVVTIRASALSSVRFR